MRLNQGSEWEVRCEGTTSVILTFEGFSENKLIFREGSISSGKKIEFTAPDFIFQCHENKIRSHVLFNSRR